MLNWFVDVILALYTASPLAFWFGLFATCLILITYLFVFSICRASGQADERAERMIAEFCDS